MLPSAAHPQQVSGICSSVHPPLSFLLTYLPSYSRLARVGRHLSTGGASTESGTEGGEEEDSGQLFTPRGTPITREMRAASLHTIMTVEALEAEGKHVEAAELLAAQLEQAATLCAVRLQPCAGCGSTVVCARLL